MEPITHPKKEQTHLNWSSLYISRPLQKSLVSR
jgi:hypothetical protein